MQVLTTEFSFGWSSPAEACEDLEDLCEGLIRINMRKLRVYRIPSLYRSGVRYHQGVSGSDCVATYQRGWGDCDDLSCWRAAEHRLSGVSARVKARHEGGERFHVYLVLPQGQVEDPSILLGMTPFRKEF